MEERRRSNDQDWDGINKFIIESREYRVRDEVTQKFQVENIEALKNQVKTQNGRVFTLEKWKEEADLKIKQKKDNWGKIQAWITGIAAVIMAVSAVVVMFKK